MLLTGAGSAQTSKDTTIDDMFQDIVMKSVGWFGSNEKIPDTICKIITYGNMTYGQEAAMCPRSQVIRKMILMVLPGKKQWS